jgi:tellurite resistance protein
VSAGNLIAIIAATGAIVAVVVGWVQANATLKQNRELTDLGAVRSVLDEAVVGLLDASTQIARIREFKDRPGHLEPVWEAAERAGRGIATELERLKVRFGLEHPIVKSFEGTVAACLAVTKAANEMIDRKKIGMNTEPRDEAAAKHAALNARRKQSPGIIEQESERFESERKRFIGTAHSLAGTKLGSRHKPDPSKCGTGPLA